MYYPQSSDNSDLIHRIKQQNDIVSVIQRRVPLVKVGSQYRANCPFFGHTDKTPSFYVYPKTQSYYCFGCKASGDQIQFLREMDNLEFGEALLELAGFSNLELPERYKIARRYKTAEITTATKSELDSLLEIHKAAADYFHNVLMAKPDVLATKADYIQEQIKKARIYLKERRVTVETAKQFKLGYAFNSQNALSLHLLNKGYTKEQLIKAGLVYEREKTGEIIDRFRGRIIFPIFDKNNNVIAFGGRLLESVALSGGSSSKSDYKPPKYLNSPATDLFDKSRVLYGYNFAQEFIRTGAVDPEPESESLQVLSDNTSEIETEAYQKQPKFKARTVVIVEGYLDVVIAHQNGYKNVVAPLGTSLTYTHLKMLNHASQVILALDGDKAGKIAINRTIGMVIGSGTATGADHESETGSSYKKPELTITPQGLIKIEQQKSEQKVYIATLPDNTDPDELILADPESWQNVISTARSILDYLFALVERRQISTPLDKKKAVNDLLPVLAEINNVIEREEYIQRLARFIKQPADAIRHELGLFSGLSKTTFGTATQSTGAEFILDTEDNILIYVLSRPELLPAKAADGTPVGEKDFLKSESRELFRSYKIFQTSNHAAETSFIIEPDNVLHGYYTALKTAQERSEQVSGCNDTSCLFVGSESELKEYKETSGRFLFLRLVDSLRETQIKFLCDQITYQLSLPVVDSSETEVENISDIDTGVLEDQMLRNLVDLHNNLAIYNGR
jgi:DNA primase catalytic core